MSSKCNLLLLITYYPLPNLVWKTVPTQAGFTCSSLRAPKEAWRCQLYYYESQTEACRNEIRAQQNARSPWWRHGFAVNSTSEKYACHLYQYAPFFFRASCADRQQEIVNESGYTGLSRNSNQIINCAMLLSLGYIREATTYAESCGGGSSPGSGWGRDKDEDDDHWWRRCIAVSAAMMRPAKYRVRHGR